MAIVRGAKPERPGMSGRQDSLSRMLELEKHYKMQRTQDNGSIQSTPAGPIGTRPSPSALPDLALRVRRASAHPPPTQNMKAARRSAGLPSLSISIPPSPTSTQGVGDDEPHPAENPESVDEPRKEPGERTKTVTFSGPQEDEEDDLSDASSICHSPSWEGFGQSSKKKAKKREKKEKKKLEEQVIKASKKQSNRLSKAPPQDTQSVQALKASDRSLSAPELEQQLKLIPRSLNRSTSDFPPETMANLNPKPQASSDEGIKSKSRGFLASLRSSSTGPKKSSTPRSSVDDAQSVHNGTIAGPPSHMYNPTGPVAEHDFTNPRQAPSIRSDASGSTQSMSSQEKRPGLGRHHSNAGHGRSSETKEDKPRPPLSRSALSSIEVMSAPQHNSRPASATSFSQSSSQKVEGDNGERGRQPTAHSSRPRDSSSDYDEIDHTERRERRLHATGYASAPQQPIANEGRRRPHSYATKSRNGEVEALPSGEQTPSSHRNQAKEHAEAQRVPQRPIRELEVQVQRTKQARRESNYQSNIDSYASPYRDEVDRLSAKHRLHNEEDRGFVDKHVSTVKQPSVALDPRLSGLEESGPEKKVSPSPSVIGRAVSHDDDFGNVTESSEETPVIEVVTREEEPAVIPSTHQRPYKKEKPADYFAFISESYAPPSLELRSLTEGRTPSSPRIDEASDEDDEEEPWSVMAQSLENARGPLTQAATAATGVHTFVPMSLLGGSPIGISPAISVDQSDSDVPAFEHLGDAAHEPDAVEARYQPQSLQEGQSSGNNSERSSSSMNGEARPLTSAMTTPDSSRPHSRRGQSVDIVPRSTVKSALTQADERAAQKACRASIIGTSTVGRSSRTSNPDAYTQDDSWSRTALPIDHDTQSVTSTHSNRLDALVSTPSPAGTPTSVAFADELKEGTEETVRAPEAPRRHTLPPKAHSSIDLPATNFLPPLRHQPLYPRKTKIRGPSASLPTSLPNSPPPEFDTEAPALRPTSLKSSRKNSSTSQDSQQSPASASAAYLQEARKTVPVHPLSSRALRPVYPPKGTLPPAARSASPERKGEPLAKMLVECCNCKFFHDMPSRVYECMAKPDSVVEDKLLGVSATITTMVKCPWCAHGMTTQCCSGYAAVVYLKEKLHGK
ncbi:hypothetical protein PG993_009902 [Apiospora rasikravindrae]|uniref:Uncharacterized protein n=1 Tax=Apiospora rasikravindrae TaxID=990691 RepID=A0ABR1SKP6_9PEZI